MSSSEKKKMSAKDMAFTGMFAAVIAVLSQIAIPLPSGVPVTLQTFAVALAGYTLGMKLGGLSAIVYVLIGAVGVPVFSGFKGGLGSLTGPTGGFIWGSEANRDYTPELLRMKEMILDYVKTENGSGKI